MFALWWREHGGEGKGQVIDLSIYEPLFWVLGPQALVYDQLGIVQGRTGNRAPFTAPRNAYLTKDGRWLGLSASAQSIAERVMRIVGRPELIEEPWFADHMGRIQHVDELDEIIQGWIGERTTEEVLAAFAEGEAAIAPIYSIEDIVEDPQYLERETLVRVPHPKLGSVLMQNVIPRLSDTPGSIRHPGPEIGEHNEDVYCGELGLSGAELEDLREAGVI
jgi:formyl-CoA transferase